MQSLKKQTERFILVSPPASGTGSVQEKKVIIAADDHSPGVESDMKEPKLVRTPKLSGMFISGGKGLRYRVKLFSSQTVTVNSGLGKYLQFIAGANFLTWGATLAGSVEFSSLDAVFDEFFIESVALHYTPRNRYSAQSTASNSASGNPGDLNTCAATVACLLHNAALYTDTSSAFAALASCGQSKLVDMGQGWKIHVKNPEKFSWDGPLGDMSTARSTMSWCQTTNTNSYGGVFQLATPAASGASLGVGTLLENGVFGDLLTEINVAFRARA